MNEMYSIKINQIFPGSFYFRWTRFPIKWEMAAARYSFGLNRRSDAPVTLTKSIPGNARAPREKGDRREMKASAAEAAQKHKDDTKSQEIQNYLSQKPQTVSEIPPMYF